MALPNPRTGFEWIKGGEKIAGTPPTTPDQPFGVANRALDKLLANDEYLDAAGGGATTINVDGGIEVDLAGFTAGQWNVIDFASLFSPAVSNGEFLINFWVEWDPTTIGSFLWLDGSSDHSASSPVGTIGGIKNSGGGVTQFVQVASTKTALSDSCIYFWAENAGGVLKVYSKRAISL